MGEKVFQVSDFYFEHQQLSKRFKLLATKEIPEMRVFDRHVGMFYIKRIIGAIIDYSPIKINKPGMSDAYAIIRLPGLAAHIEIEYKSGKSGQTKDQKNWERFIHSMGGAYFLVRDEREGIEQIKNYIRYLNGIISKTH